MHVDKEGEVLLGQSVCFLMLSTFSSHGTVQELGLVTSQLASTTCCIVHGKLWKWSRAGTSWIA